MANESRNVMLPLYNPPKILKISAPKRKTAFLKGDIQMTLENFARLIDQVKLKKFEFDMNKVHRPLQSDMFSQTRPETCSVCKESLVNVKTKRLKSSCSNCLTKYSKNIFLQPFKENDEVYKYYNKWLTIVHNDRALLVPPINYYIGNLAKGMLSDLISAFEYLSKNKKAHVYKRYHRIIKLQNLKESAPIRKRKNVSEETVKTFQRTRKTIETSPQRALCYTPIYCSKIIDRPRRGKENEIRRICMSRVITCVSRLTIGTNGALRAGQIALPNVVMRNLGPSRHYLTIRYPVIQSGNITYAEALKCNNKTSSRTTCDFPSSQFKFNGGDNDGDAFNFIRLNCGLLSNSAYETKALMSPEYNIGYSNDIRVCFDSDTRIGLGSKWEKILENLRLEYLITNNSSEVFRKFCDFETLGRTQVREKGFCSLSEYFPKSERLYGLNHSYGLGRMIDSKAVGRFNINHYEQACKRLGHLEFVYNQNPIKQSINSSFTTGFTASEFTAVCQASFDALADRESEKISTQGNLQYQCQYVLRPMVLSYDRKTVTNPVTKKVIAKNVSSIYVSRKGNLSDESLSTIFQSALLFGCFVFDFTDVISENFSKIQLQTSLLTSIKKEANQYKKLVIKK